MFMAICLCLTVLNVCVRRAYHFGARFMVEAEVIMPIHFTLKQVHDISLSLQHKVRMQHRHKPGSLSLLDVQSMIPYLVSLVSHFSLFCAHAVDMAC